MARSFYFLLLALFHYLINYFALTLLLNTIRSPSDKKLKTNNTMVFGGKDSRDKKTGIFSLRDFIAFYGVMGTLSHSKLY